MEFNLLVVVGIIGFVISISVLIWELFIRDKPDD
jgi:hypothetical protein